MRKYVCLLMLAASLSGFAASNMEINFHNEGSDTTRINEILIDVAAKKFDNPEARTAYIGRKFLGTPYVAHTLEGESEVLTVNLDELDCTTFVETVMAMSYTAGENRSSWQDFTYNLERIRYRNGEVNGYASRLHYICDWSVDNIHRGNFKDVTDGMPKCNYIVRSIDYMSANRDKYPALADSAEFARIKNVEAGYTNHRFPYVKTIDLQYKEVRNALHEGDVVALVTTLKNLDVTHMGIVVFENGVPHLLHASSSNGCVEISQLPLYDFLKKNRTIAGIRVYRLVE